MNISLMEIYKEIVPFVFLQILRLIIVIVFPSLTTWLTTLVNKEQIL